MSTAEMLRSALERIAVAVEEVRIGETSIAAQVLDDLENDLSRWIGELQASK
jgi:hypothetical protein